MSSTQASANQVLPPPVTTATTPRSPGITPGGERLGLPEAHLDCQIQAAGGHRVAQDTAGVPLGTRRDPLSPLVAFKGILLICRQSLADLTQTRK